MHSRIEEKSLCEFSILILHEPASVTRRFIERFSVTHSNVWTDVNDHRPTAVALPHNYQFFFQFKVA